MSLIQFTHAHALGADVLRQRLGALEGKLQERYGVKLSWQGQVATLSGPGVQGTLSLAERDVSVQLKLGMMLRPLAGQIREALQRQVERALGG